jgi:sterol desaturase/sphingolipid hydroxylase (fatty acid hydroxylase superfamily)
MSASPQATRSDLPRHFGSGWISGTLAIFLGGLAVGAVLCFWFPSLLTMPELRAVYPMGVVRFLVQSVILGAFSLGMVSVVLRRSKWLGLTGAGLAVLAVLMGGAQVPVEGPVARANHLGLDWFLLNLLLLAMIFVPMERLFARLKDQKTIRPGWSTDLAHFFSSHMLIQVTAFLTLLPATVVFRWAVSPAIQNAVASQPGPLQFLEIVFLADLTEYIVHRLFHRIPFLWRFHAIHHSAQHMDWLAGSRLHFVDIVVTRGLTFVPLFVLGFAPAPLYFYLVFVSFHAVFIHANVGFDFGRFESWVVTPRFHHWHHAASKAAIDKNFAVHLPFIDRWFGSHYLPGKEWPSKYGIEGDPVPESYVQHWISPFHKGTQ